ncbi:hypothetical protein POTOM_029327 [Populus tomentosa]|uniref:Uncharacterized protein n=1 Tax=Populus tomentosa TaxID=118781 RepID=A0A8X7Z8S9_POPTO|nr:hypothetical protein POTOM_029327 [Populus tomentosa]
MTLKTYNRTEKRSRRRSEERSNRTKNEDLICLARIERSRRRTKQLTIDLCEKVSSSYFCVSSLAAIQVHTFGFFNRFRSRRNLSPQVCFSNPIAATVSVFSSSIQFVSVDLLFDHLFDAKYNCYIIIQPLHGFFFQGSLKQIYFIVEVPINRTGFRNLAIAHTKITTHNLWFYYYVIVRYLKQPHGER